MLGHVGDCNASRLLLTNSLVEEQALDTDTKVLAGDDSSVLGFPIEEPVSVDGHGQVAIGSSNSVGGQGRNTSLESGNNSGVNYINDGSNEEDLKGRSKVGPNVAPDLNVDVPSVYVSGDVYAVDGGNSSAVSKLLCDELEAETNLDSVHDDIEVTLRNERPLLVAECIVVEDTGQLVAAHDERILVGVGVDQNVVGALIHDEGVTSQVVTLVVLDVGNLHVVDDCYDVVEVGVLGLLQDRDVHGGLDAGGQVRLGKGVSGKKRSSES
jgi:hypothetical protein